MLNLFIKGFVIGLSIAAPVDPIGILCINRTLSGGLLAGLLSGLGTAVADALYGCIAGFGLVIDKILLIWINRCSGIILITFGVFAFITVIFR